MKHRLSISVDEETIALIQAKLRQGRDKFRNKSHVVELAVKRFMEVRE